MHVIIQNSRALRKIISCERASIKWFSFPAHGLHSWTNSITTTQGFGKFSFRFNVANYIELLKTVCVKRCMQAKAKKSSKKRTLYSRSSVAIYYQLNGNNVLRVKVYIHTC